MIVLRTPSASEGVQKQLTSHHMGSSATPALSAKARPIKTPEPNPQILHLSQWWSIPWSYLNTMLLENASRLQDKSSNASSRRALLSKPAPITILLSHSCGRAVEYTASNIFIYNLYAPSQPGNWLPFTETDANTGGGLSNYCVTWLSAWWGVSTFKLLLDAFSCSQFSHVFLHGRGIFLCPENSGTYV